MLGLEVIKEKAELLDIKLVQHPDCDHVKVMQENYRFYVRNSDGSMTEETASISSPQDVTHAKKVANIDEPTKHEEVLIRPYLNCFEQEDQFLIEELRRSSKLVSPSKEAYNWTVDDVELMLEGEYGQAVFIDKVLFKENLNNGFFIEAGAADSERESNSLLFEVKRGWSGLLVEPSPIMYPRNGF